VRHLPQIKAWKIEGRKKGPHYVFYTVQAYRILRDIDEQPESRVQIKKTAVALLKQALGRPGTHYNFLPQKPKNPIDINFQTGSGLFVGKIQGPARRPYVAPRFDLLKGDVLRLGYEDERWHAVNRVSRAVPKGGRYTFPQTTKRPPARGTPVFLTDRREKYLKDLLADLEHKLNLPEVMEKAAPDVPLRLPRITTGKPKVRVLQVHRQFNNRSPGGHFGLWLSREVLEHIPKHVFRRVWWWLPPVVWPGEEKALSESIAFAQRHGSRHFVLNTPWQTSIVNTGMILNLWAGPFCNLSNPMAFVTAAGLGFTGAIISPELGVSDILSLPSRSSLPLGIIIGGNWPLCISRTLAGTIKTDQPFTSPKGEKAWVHQYGSNYWVFPNWKLDLRAKESALKKAGFQVFIHLVEPIPKGVELKKRPGLWNWDIGLK
jgi:putative protease